MFISFFTGFFLGLSLILAIGAQNAFVLRQGILKEHIFFVVLFCSLADALLIIVGISGISFFFNHFVSHNANIIFGLSSIWLFGYGVIKLKSIFQSNEVIKLDRSLSKGLVPTISVAAVLTFLNPHVYLDTMILIGSISQQYTGFHKITFGFGACLASFIFFFSIGYGAKLLTPFMQKPLSWKVLDSLIAIVMFSIAFKLLSEGNWI